MAMKTPGTSTAGYGNARFQSEMSTDSRIYLPSISSEEMLDENAQSQKGRFGGQRAGRANRKLLIAGLLLVVAVAGAIVAYMVTKSDPAATNASNESGTAGSGSKSNSTSTSGGSSGTSSTTKSPSGSSGSTPSGNAKVKVRTDPLSDTYPVVAFAIGDWGQTIAPNDSCCQRRKGKFNGYDWHAEVGVAKLMDIEAKSKAPAVVISHGDNFYWTGIEGDKYQKYRFEETFESRHKGEGPMASVPWVNVMGNHDYGGGSWICVNGDEERAKCADGADLVRNLKRRFDWQAKYKSPNNDRWVLTDHFYKYTVTKGDVSMDIFNLDMNDAESHGAHEICCQCYDYASGNSTICKNIQRGDKNCCGGDGSMYDACKKQFSDWGDEAMTKLVEEVKKSKATWKVINSHYSPYGHYGEPSGKKWMETLNGLGVQVWIAGHTHGEKHDYAAFGMHFIENGAGGGIQSESNSGIPGWASGLSNLWSAAGVGDGGNAYGFFSLEASTSWMKVRFMTFDDKWNLAVTEKQGDFNPGGVTARWCYYVPLDGTEGQKC